MEELLNMMERMLRERVAYHQEHEDYEAANAYSSSLFMLQYARDNNYEGLANFDYYGEM